MITKTFHPSFDFGTRIEADGVTGVIKTMRVEIWPTYYIDHEIELSDVIYFVLTDAEEVIEISEDDIVAFYDKNDERVEL